MVYYYTKTTLGTMVLQGIRNVVPVGKKKNSRIKKCNAVNKRGITFNVRNLIIVDPDFNRKELLNKFVQDVEYILLSLGDQYSKSNSKKEITEQLYFLKGECGKTVSRTRIKKELCWKHTILLVLDVEKILNVDEKYNDWLNPYF
ncbi:unnamed protein product [Didymodactylos carnosus]|uniref:Uncharacterized protein n=1 Tax=Didymodactylos carnosus TaxID=1234261 RepID=A0A816B7Y0_9BILA|nr:unnamed protein product [Didymodactylos carnosus]CAF4486986.1 unnamed protein product [Didymodactylos carnosus]